ncbi:MAG: hypothetical protein ACI9W4_000607 [Rhodothermales bacterium]|jgi:hypothetical protein
MIRGAPWRCAFTCRSEGHHDTLCCYRGGATAFCLRFSLRVLPGPGATGVLRVILSHYDDEPKDGVSRSSETDIDLSFPVRIQ